MINIQKRKYECLCCNKQYSRISSYEKHKILCDIKFQTKNERAIEQEEEEDIPTYSDLIKIVHELSRKYNKLTKEVEVLKKIVNVTKKKVNVLKWLNDNINMNCTFDDWNKTINVNAEHLQTLMKSTLSKSVQEIFEYNMLNISIVPFKCFSEKMNTIYIYNETWLELSTHTFSDIIQKIQKNLTRLLLTWNVSNDKLDTDKKDDIFNKTVIKLMDIDFNGDPNINRMYNALYNHLKININIIEYEIGFTVEQ